MNSVEQNKAVEEEKRSEDVVDSLHVQELPSHAGLPGDADATDVTAVALPAVAKEVQIVTKSAQKALSFPAKKAQKEAEMLRIRCKQLGVATFFQEQASVHSLGFTSAIAGEGKSFLARMMAESMAEDDAVPVTLLECNWENPSLSADFHLMQDPGLAEWLRGDCTLPEMRHQVYPNLTVIPAGNSKNNEIGLLRVLQQKGIFDVLSRPKEILIVDLPSIATTPYGRLAASLTDSLILVVRAGVTPESYVTEATSMLKDLAVQGVIFNQVKSSVPRWIRQIL